MTDAELVIRLQANDDAANHVVVARYADSLYGYIYRIIGDPHLSEDILSETYLRLADKIDSYSCFGPPFKAWLYRIAHHLAVNGLKAARRSVRISDFDARVPQVDAPATVVAAQLEAAEPRAALAELPESNSGSCCCVLLVA